MNHRIANIALLVKDYDEAIAFYTKVMQFDLLEDTDMGNGKRWVRVKPVGEGASNLLLAKAKNEEQKAAVGNQCGGRVFIFLHIDNFDEYMAHLQRHDVEIVRGPESQDYGKVAVIADLYGNKWDIIEPLT